MSMMYCETCDKQIDTDFDAEHFDDHKLYSEVAQEYFCSRCGDYMGEAGWTCQACDNNS